MKCVLTISAVVIALAAGTHANGTKSLRVTLDDAGGPPTVTSDTVAVEQFNLGSACRRSLGDGEAGLKAEGMEGLAKHLDACTVWLIWDKLRQPAGAADLTAARIEIRNVAALRRSNIELTRLRCELPTAGIGEQAMMCVLRVGIDLKNGRGVELSNGAKGIGLNITAGIKELAKAPGIYPRPATKPATSQRLETY